MGSCYVVKEMVAIEAAWKVTLTGGNSGGGGGRNGRFLLKEVYYKYKYN